jgi:hypothetical protein
MRGASLTISDQVFEYWSQNKNLEVQFIVEAGLTEDPPPFNAGLIVEARIRNALHRMTVPFNDRSAGFVWFFSFLVYFSQVRKTHGNVVILLDEPGLALHAKAQNDLLRYFDEKLKPSHQVIYTTHSPFMVPASNLPSVRTVEDVIVSDNGSVTSIGTKVGDEVLSKDRDTLFPLQAALGYEITQTLFVGEHSLLVEGPSDYLYLFAFSEELSRVKRTGLDSRWTICPTGGIDKVPAFVSLFGGNKLDIAVLVDYAHGQKAKVEWLRGSGLLKAQSVFTCADFVQQTDADVEDLVGPELYADLLNATYELTGKNLVTGKALGLGGGKRAVEKAKEVFSVMPSKVANFDHYRPAEYLLTHADVLRRPTPYVVAALDRFETLFKALNSTIGA